MVSIRPGHDHALQAATFFNEAHVETTLKPIYVGFVLALLPLNLIFNLLLISAVCIIRQLHTMQHALIASIAFFDTLHGLVITPLYVLNYSGITIFTGNKYGCIGMYSLIMMVVNGRCLFLQMLTLDRYTAIQHPFWYHKHVHVYHGKLYKCCVGCTLAYITLIGSLPMLGVNTYREGYCSFYSIWPVWFEWSFFYVIQVLTALIPTIFNILIFIGLKRRKTYDSERPSHFQSQIELRDEKSHPSDLGILGNALRRVSQVSSSQADRQVSYVSSSHADFRSEVAVSRSIRVSMAIYFAYLIFYVPACIAGILRASQRYLNHEEEYAIYLDYIATILQFGFMGAISPLLMFFLKRDYRTAVRTILRTPCWRWHELKHDKLGHGFSTSHLSVKDFSSKQTTNGKNTMSSGRSTSMKQMGSPVDGLSRPASDEVMKAMLAQRRVSRVTFKDHHGGLEHTDEGSVIDVIVDGDKDRSSGTPTEGSSSVVEDPIWSVLFRKASKKSLHSENQDKVQRQRSSSVLNKI